VWKKRRNLCGVFGKPSAGRFLFFFSIFSIFFVIFGYGFVFCNGRLGGCLSIFLGFRFLILKMCLYHGLFGVLLRGKEGKGGEGKGREGKGRKYYILLARCSVSSVNVVDSLPPSLHPSFLELKSG